MKNYFSRLGKGLAAFLACLLSMNLFCLPLFAQDTEIFTVVPDMHFITVTISKGGAAIGGNGVVHTESFTAEVPHNGTFALILRPDSGYKLESVFQDGKAVDVSAGRLELENVLQDGELSVSFQKAAGALFPKTYTVVGTVTENGKPASGITLELRSTLKTFTTGEDGKFRFDQVEAEEHSLTALRNGKVVGYLEFQLETGDAALALSRLPDGSFQIQMDQDITTLKLDVLMGDDGILELSDVGYVTGQQVKEDYPPATGDNIVIVYYLVVLFAAGGFLVLLRECRKYKKIG